MKFIHVRQAEAAAFAALGYAKYTGRLGVCLATSGPGGIHLLHGLYDAKCDGHAVLAITGHTFHDLIGTHYQQDVDLDKLFMDVSVYNERIMGSEHVTPVVDEAIRTAFARRGVAHVAIPKDIQEWPASSQKSSDANVANHCEHRIHPFSSHSDAQFSRAGGYAHLVGAARMGSDPRTSVVDKFGWTHDLSNLFVCDGSILPTQGQRQSGVNDSGISGANS